jgi:epoxyqueuosine reductase QueG
MDKEQIRHYGLQLGADVVGFAAVEDYHSQKAPDPKTLLPDVQSIVVLGYRELDGAMTTPNHRLSFASRMGSMELSLKNNYLVARRIENDYRVKAVPVPASYPLDMSTEVMGLVGDLSLRHAAVAAGLGVFGRHNLVINPRFGTRIIFTAVLTELPLESDPPVEDELCDQCNLCVEACPAQALDHEGQTDALKCLSVSQPYGIGGTVRYLRRFVGTSPQEQKELLRDPDLLHIYQAQFMGFQYHCFACMAACPACVES